MSAVKVEWALPVYSGGQTALLFNIYDRFRGLLNQNIAGNSTVVFLNRYYSYNVYVTVISSENDDSLSERSLPTYFFNEGTCAG